MINSLKLTLDGNCPTCNQKLPGEQIEKLVLDAQAKLEIEKKRELEAINFSGKNMKSKLDQIELSIHSTTKDIEITKRNIEEHSINLKEIETILSQDQQFVNFSDSKTWVTLESEINDLNVQITDFKELDTSSLDTQKTNLKQDIQSHMNTLSKQTQYDLAMVRKKELMDEEKTVAKLLNELESQEFQIQKYSDTKMSYLEEIVNGMFENIKIRMFKEQDNGTVKDDCTILDNGTPYESTNYAARINAGLEFIKTLSKEYNIYVPCFVDNAESVTKVVQLDQQQILLIKDENYKELAIIQETYKEDIAV